MTVVLSNNGNELVLNVILDERLRPIENLTVISMIAWITPMAASRRILLCDALLRSSDRTDGNI
jgi:hypothetical protein